MMIPHIALLTRGDDLVGDDDFDTCLLRKMNEDAKSYISTFKWCGGVKASYFGDGYGGVIAAFLMNIVPLQERVNEWLWVIVGDVPLAYLFTDEIPSASMALKRYVGLMHDWVSAAENGRSVEKLIPVNVPATMASALALKKRLGAIEQLALF